MRGILATFALLSLFFFGASSVATANTISAENLLPGAPPSQWDLAAGGSTAIQGFTTDISVNHGSTVNFKIQTSATSWRIDIYRLGYYQGNGARLVTTINKSGAAVQPNPLVDSATGLVDAGNWSVTASWAVPANAVSGVYIAHLVNNANTTQENHIAFIVRADESTSDIVFKTADSTWQAYNGWPCGSAATPSNNLYGGSGPGGDSAPGRAYKVSYNRPIATRDSCGTTAAWMDFVFAAEYPAIYWLEQNGYDVTYISQADVSRNASNLLKHKLFISNGHDEYWDGPARSSVSSAFSSGVNLAFWSGNEVYWKTRWEPSIDGTSTAYRTLVCYKETRHNGPLDPLDASPTYTWTGTWRDPRNSPPADGGSPENALTGTIFQVDSYRSDAIQVPYSMSRLRFWRNTQNVSRAATNATTTLVQNILGYEWDISPDNGQRPKGLINLSSTTLSVSSLLLDYGQTVGTGSATHNLTLFRHPTSNALAFGAGTVFWSWGLSAQHDGPNTPTDPNIQQATVNLLADMGVQPATLQSPLVAATKSTDVTPPTATISGPANGSNYAEGQPVTITGAASDVGGIVAGVEVSIDGGPAYRATGTTSWTFTWTATPGTHTIAARATDDSVNTGALSTAISVNVSSSGSTLFGSTAVPSTQTAQDASQIELGVKFSTATSGKIYGVRFYKDWINNGPHTASLWGPGGSLLATANFVAETPRGWQTVLFAAPVSITPGTTYTASYHTNGFYSATTAYFSTPLTVGNLTVPANGGVYLYGASAAPTSSFGGANYWVDVLFAPTPITNPPVISSTLTASGTLGTQFSYQITATNSPTSFNAVGLPSGLSINTTTGVISGSPTATGLKNVVISATNGIGTGSATLALNIGAVPSSYSLFSRSSAPSTVTVNDPTSVELGVKFIAASSGAITGLTFYKGPQNVGTHTGHLWDASGNLLATVTFANETASGWQTAQFSSPVSIQAGATYVASYHTSGYYSADGAFFASDYNNGPLTAPASGGNGVYAYGATAVFPTNSYNAANYWVDVLFSPGNANVTNPPVINSALTASAFANQPFSYQITGTNSPTVFAATGLPQGLSLNVWTGVISGTPTAVGTSNISISASNIIGTGSATLVLNVNQAPTTYSLFPANSVPATVTVFDSNSVELGVKFVASSNRSITGLRFYKGPQNVGAHTANLWDASGNLLASAVFANETASGWQTVSFSSPVPITSGVTYVASYHTSGYYSATGAFFANDYVNGPLTAPAAGGNGVYAYGASASVFPTGSYNATNYWVDVVLQ